MNELNLAFGYQIIIPDMNPSFALAVSQMEVLSYEEMSLDDRIALNGLVLENVLSGIAKLHDSGFCIRFIS
jgi:hypothetical protein